MKAIDNKGLELFKLFHTEIQETEESDLCCPKIYNAAVLSFDEVRQMTIKMPGKEFRHPQTWKPYLNFRRYSCISMHPDSEVYYSFGDDVHVSDKEQLLSIPEELLQDKMNCAKQTRVRTSKKRALPDTLRKQNPRKRQPLMSTPRYGNKHF
ncbi:hypothetical protein ACJMK2_037096 [Sinanodonta woodiana]|uniref:Uncharacterized protein n=1 Tax=Sinanodonta woodiana TaxID=1069815 RepID=A0ABD3WMR1_SINWO